MNVITTLNIDKSNVENHIKRHIRTICYINNNTIVCQDDTRLNYIASIIFEEAVIKVVSEFRKEVSLLLSNININEEYREVLNNKVILKAIEITDKLFIEFYQKK